MTADVCLEYHDDQWHVARRREEPLPTSSHEPVLSGYTSPEAAADAAIEYALQHDLTVEARNDMIEGAYEFLLFVERDEVSFVA